MLTVEDGSGLPASESYISVAAADTRLAAHGFILWATLSTAEKEQALRRATTYMVGVYRERWAGYRVSTTQALDWPRYQAPIKDSASMNYGGRSYYPSNAVPASVANACADLALKAAAGDLAPDIDRQTKTETVGPISVSYMDGASPFVRYRAIDLALAPFLSGNASSMRIVRS